MVLSRETLDRLHRDEVEKLVKQVVFLQCSLDRIAGTGNDDAKDALKRFKVYKEG